MFKTVRMTLAAAGMLMLAAGAASAADFKLANPAKGQGLVINTAMGVAPLATENPVIKTQRRLKSAGRSHGGRSHHRGRNVGKGVAIGLGVLAGAALIAGAANANSYRESSGSSCRRWNYLCNEEGRGWACRKFDRNC